MITKKAIIQRYANELEARYAAIQSILSGRQATHNDRFHGVKGRGHWPDEMLQNMFIVDNLDLTLAIDDLSAILKEIKKLVK